MKTAAYAAQGPATPLAPFSIERRELGPKDVHIQNLYCGVCHSDLHTARNEWSNTVYPVVPGHEIVGRIEKTGQAVKHFKEGDLVGVGCMVGSCGECRDCTEGLEQYCQNGCILTYNGIEKETGKITYGGYSTQIVVNESFVLRIPDNLDLAGAAPLLCAGVTTYSPLRHWKITAGKKVGVIGLGGLGHMAVKLAHAMGAQVVLFTTSESKVQDGKRLGADSVVISKNMDEVKKHRGSFDFILNTVAASHNLDPYIGLLKRDATMCLIGAPERPHPAVTVAELIFRRRQIGGSLIGGIKETQQMLDFCGKHNITSDIEMVAIQKINEAYERMLRGDVKYRFVIDIASLR